MPHLTPDAAIATFTLGILLIYWELNRPGTILPGALGLLAALYSIAVFAHTGFQTAGVILIATATVLLALGLRHTFPSIIPIAATTTLILGLYLFIKEPASKTHAATSLLCGLILGITSSRLAAIAHRARRNKGSACGHQGLD